MAADQIDPVLHLLNERPREDWEWSFDAAADGENAQNAVSLCNAALLTYSPGTDVLRFLAKWGFEETRLLRGFSTQGFVARQDDIVVVAFRGTEPLNAGDWLSDVNYHQIAMPNVAGMVHGGFAHAAAEIRAEMLAAVAEFGGDGERVYCTGHSMGGALAVLAAAMIQSEARATIGGVLTFGQPRVGDPAFSSAFNESLGAVTFRYVNDRDIVPHIPPPRLPARAMLRSFAPTIDLHEIQAAIHTFVEGERFEHAGQLRLLRDGAMTDDPQERQAQEFILSRRLKEILTMFPHLVRAELGQLLSVQDRFLDHDPAHGYLPRLEARLTR